MFLLHLTLYSKIMNKFMKVLSKLEVLYIHKGFYVTIIINY